MTKMSVQPITDFMKQHYRHFNAAMVMDASQAYHRHIDSGNIMLMTLAGAMSTAELGISLSEMIRKEKVHAICCTGANLEEDIFNLVAHDHYERIADWRALTVHHEAALAERGMNRVTDTCIPEGEAMRRVEKAMWVEWQKAEAENKILAPHEFFFNLLGSGALKEFYQIDPKDSWVATARDKNLPIFTPGWEDSTMGNMFAAACMTKKVKNPHVVESGIQTMIRLAQWYTEASAHRSIGFFQIGGGIAGDFPICVVPMLNQDLRKDVKLWGYFCQISDSTTSYGSYSGAVPNEKITWGKLGIDTPKFIIESDASIVAPLIFAHVLGW